MSPRARIAGRIAIAATSTLIALALAEVTVRALEMAPSRWAQPRHVETDDKRLGVDLYPDDPRDTFPIDLRDARVRARYRERGLALDAYVERTPHGIASEYTAELCRGAAIPEGRRIVAIGDSFTEGQGVTEEHTFAALLDARLAPARVVNCGRRGYDFPALGELFDRHLALDPDIVVYAMVLNDPVQSSAFHARQAYIDDWIVDRRRMVSEGDGTPPLFMPRLYLLAEDRVESLRVGAATEAWYCEMVGDSNHAGWDATLDHIARMQRTMRERGGELVVVLWPLLVDLDAYPFEATHRTIVRDLRAHGVRVHDTLPAFRGADETTLWVHPSDRHPNERAHAIFADSIEPVVRRAMSRTR